MLITDTGYEVVVMEAGQSPEEPEWVPFHGQTVAYEFKDVYYNDVTTYHKFKHFVYWRRIKG